MAIEIKPLDYVLMRHEYLYDCMVVRQVTHVTQSTVQVRKIFRDNERRRDDQEEPSGRRKRAAVRGVFKDREAALKARAIVKELYEQLLTDKGALITKFRADCRALLGGDDGEG
jgi:hypothetical protein